MVLGDLFHSSPNRAWVDFEHWLDEERLAGLHEALLVRGNHDKAQDSIYESMGLIVVESWESDGVVLTHDPEDEIPKGAAVHICGHIHPAVRMRGAGRQSMCVPCFVQSSTGCDAGVRLILPAFGAFTGTHVVQPKRGLEVYVVTETGIMGPLRSKPHGNVSRRGRK